MFALVACGGTPIAIGPTATPTPLGLGVSVEVAKITSDAAIYAVTQSAIDLKIAEAAKEQATADANARLFEYTLAMSRTASALAFTATQAAMTANAQVSMTAIARTQTAMEIADGRAGLQATATAEAIKRDADEQASWETTWSFVRWMILIGTGAIMLTLILVIAVVGYNKLTEILDAAVKIANAFASFAQARAEANRIIYVTEYIEGKQQDRPRYLPAGGGPPIELPAATPSTDAQLAVAEIDRRKELWKRALMRLTSFAGDGEYTFPRLVNELKIVDPENWKLLTCYMVENHYLSSKGKGSKKVWADGWDKAKFHEAIKAGGLPPFPISKDAPVPEVLTPA